MKKLIVTLPGSVHQFEAYQQSLSSANPISPQCQDKVCVRSRNSYVAAVLCDGAGSYRHSEVGAESLSAAVAEWLLDTAKLLFALPCAQIRYKLIFQIKQTLNHLCRLYKESEYQFSSTLVGGMLNTNTGQAILFHLGDGIILSGGGSSELHAVSLPENGESRYSTWLSCSSVPELEKHLRVSKVMDARTLVLMSDGASGLLYSNDGEEISPSIQALQQQLSCCSARELCSLLKTGIEALDPSDDFSFCMIRGEAVERRSAHMQAKRRDEIYMMSKLSGMSENQSIHAAGWGRRTAKRRIPRITYLTSPVLQGPQPIPEAVSCESPTPP